LEQSSTDSPLKKYGIKIAPLKIHSSEDQLIISMAYHALWTTLLHMLENLTVFDRVHPFSEIVLPSIFDIQNQSDGWHCKSIS
jgi:hypothetical protein